MRKMIKLSWVFLLIGCLFLTSCEDSEEDPFSGGDNYIASFILKNGDKKIKATIDMDTLIMTAPEDFDLSSATAEVTLSENATIKPDPTAITDWSSEYIFIVTAFNGENRSYKYTLSNSENSVEGSVILRTQADVDAFGKQNITSIKGNLIIGTSSGTDSITSLAALNKVREIGYGLIIQSTYASETLNELTGLKKVDGAIQIKNKRLTELQLPALTSVAEIEVTASAIRKINFPKLTTISRKLLVSATNLLQFEMPLLETVTGDISLTATVSEGEETPLRALTFPVLQQVDGTISISTGIKTVNLPELNRCGALNVSGNGLATVALPQLEECEGLLQYNQMIALLRVELPVLKHAGSLRISDCTYLEDLDIPVLESVDEDVVLSLVGDEALAKLDNFRVLHTVGKGFAVGGSGITTITSLSFPSTLKSCETLSVTNCSKLTHLTIPTGLETCQTLEINGCESLEVFDLTGIKAKTILLKNFTLKNITLKGEPVFEGVIKLDAGDRYADNYMCVFPKFDGIQQIGGLDINKMVKLEIAGITKINGDLIVRDVTTSNIYSIFSMKDLVEVTGDIRIGRLTPGFYEPEKYLLECASIQKVGGYIRMPSVNTPTLSFPALTEAGGIKIQVAANVNVKEIQMPQLTTVVDSLHIYSSGNGNKGITHLNGFSKLTSVKVVAIERMQALTSYEGLKSCLPSLTKENQWVVTNNKYMPTLEDMKAGKWNEPEN